VQKLADWLGDYKAELCDHQLVADATTGKLDSVAEQTPGPRLSAFLRQKDCTHSLPQNTSPVHPGTRFILETASRRWRVSAFRVELFVTNTFSGLIAAIAGATFAAAASAGW
jgi:hypothetical protein